MGSKDATKIHRIHARVFVDPTDLGAANYGGTEIGAVTAIAWRTGERYVPVIAEELGGPVDFARIEDSFIVAMRLRQFDATALAAIYRSTSAGSSSGDPVVSFPAARNLGDDGLMLNERRKVLVASERSDQPSLILYSALGIPDDQERVRMSILFDAVYPAVFLGVKDGAGRIAQWGRVEDLSL